MITSKAEFHPVPEKAPWYHDVIGPISPASSKGNMVQLTISDYFPKLLKLLHCLLKMLMVSQMHCSR